MTTFFIIPEIETTTGSYFVSVDSAEERDEWIDSIRKASVSCVPGKLGSDLIFLLAKSSTTKCMAGP